jgi:hypothetical protein
LKKFVLDHPISIFFPLGLACVILVVCGFSGVPLLKVTGYETQVYLILALGIILMVIPFVFFFFRNDDR